MGHSRKYLILLCGIATPVAMSPVWAQNVLPAQEKKQKQPAVVRSEVNHAADSLKEVQAKGGDETIIVTAQKRAESTQRVPSSLVAITGERLRNSLITRANDVSRFVPNFNGDDASGNATPRWYLRGIGNSVPGNGQTSPLGVYQDEVYIGPILAQAFPLYDLERVEVLSGPQGTLWGKNTTAGAINFISRKPSLTHAGGYARSEYGSFNRRLLEVAGGTPLSDKVAIRGSGYYVDDDGLATNHYNGSKINRNREINGRFQVLAKPTDNFTALLKLEYRDYHNEGDTLYSGLLPTDTAHIPAPKGYDNQSSVGYSGTNLTHKSAQLNLDWALGRYTLTSINAIDGYDSQSILGTQVAHEGTHTYSKLSEYTIFNDLRLVSPGSDRFHWIVGANYYHERMTSDAATVGLPNNVGLATSYTDTFFRQTDSSYALYANAAFNITKRLTLTGGIRQTWEDKAINLNAYGYTAGAGALSFADLNNFWLRNGVSGPGLHTTAVQNAKRGWDALTYDVTLTYSFIDNARAYFRYAKGFRSGGFNTGASTQSQLAIVNPEYIRAYEVGLKSEWFHGKLTANLAAFLNDYTDIQVTVIQLPLSQLTNAGQGWSKGIEGAFQYHPIKPLRLYGTVGLLDTRYTDFPNCKSGVSCSGNQFVRAPHVSASWTVEYTHEFGNGDHLIFESNWSYRSHYYFNAGTQTAPLEQNPFVIGNASLSYRLANPRVKFTVWTRNITDSHAASTVIPSNNFGYLKYYIDPRMVGGGISGEF